ncbi:HlyD family type I secretion periplasmic adaptor subunit [Celeribacter sp. ULVN23_4]
MTPTQVWPAHRIVWFGVICVALLIGGFGTWSLFARIESAVIAPGQVQIAQNRQVVAHSDGGDVAGVFVSEGDHVRAGDILISLSKEELHSDLTLIDNQLLDNRARAARLEAERDGAADIDWGKDLSAQMAHAQTGQRDLFAARLQTAKAEIDQLGKTRHQIEVQLVGLSHQKAALSEQLTLLRKDLATESALHDRGLTPHSRVSALRRDLLGLTAEIARIETAEAQAQVKISEIDQQILKVESDRRERAITELRDIQPRITNLREQQRALRSQIDRLDIRAPVSGVVYELTVFGPGAVVQPAAPLLYIVPQDRPLTITAQISPAQVDQVFPGQAVRLRFPAFDRRTTPELEGKVTKVSPDIFINAQTGVGFYRADIDIRENQQVRLPEGAVLIPGMPVEAYMTTGARSPLAYLAKPLTDYFTRAFRED